MKDMDCESCYKRDTCENAQAGMFCAEYANKEPDPNRVEDEDEIWE